MQVSDREEQEHAGLSFYYDCLNCLRLIGSERGSEEFIVLGGAMLIVEVTILNI